jgi:hypothetical protein
MIAPVTLPARPQPPSQASPGRRLFHLLLAIAGWVLFVYWWILVLGRVSREEVRFTGIFILVTAVVVVAVTAIWSIHNRMLYRRKGPRTHVRIVPEDYTRDRLGRHVSFAGTPEALRTDPFVLIRLEHEGKTYRPASGIRSRAETGPFAGRNRITVHEHR